MQYLIGLNFEQKYIECIRSELKKMDARLDLALLLQSAKVTITFYERTKSILLCGKLVFFQSMDQSIQLRKRLHLTRPNWKTELRSNNCGSIFKVSKIPKREKIRMKIKKTNRNYNNCYAKTISRRETEKSNHWTSHSPSLLLIVCFKADFAAFQSRFCCI